MSTTKTSPYRGPTFGGGYRHNYKVNGDTFGTDSYWSNSDPTTRTETVTLGDSPKNWRQLIALGKYAGSELSGTRYRVVSQSNTVTDAQYVPTPTSPTNQLGTYTVYPICLGGDYAYPSPASVSGLPLDEARDSCKAEFLKYLIQYQRTVSGGVALGELRETLQMIRNPAKALRKRVDSWHREAMKLRARRVRRQRTRRPRAYRARDIERDLGNSWLEQAFGWQPLINDIDDAAKALARINTETFGIKTINARAGREREYGSPITGNLSGNLCSIRRLVEKPGWADVRMHGKVKADVGNPLLMKARILGFSAQDFVPTLWELTPWSFLIDYFVNIGEVLEGWSWGTSGLQWVETNESRRGQLVVTYTPFKSSNTRLVTSQTGVFITETQVVYRGRYYGGFTPSVRWQIPGMSTKWINLAALVASRGSERRFRL